MRSGSVPSASLDGLATALATCALIACEKQIASPPPVAHAPAANTAAPSNTARPEVEGEALASDASFVSASRTAIGLRERSREPAPALFYGSFADDVYSPEDGTLAFFGSERDRILSFRVTADGASTPVEVPFEPAPRKRRFRCDTTTWTAVGSPARSPKDTLLFTQDSPTGSFKFSVPVGTRVVHGCDGGHLAAYWLAEGKIHRTDGTGRVASAAAEGTETWGWLSVAGDMLLVSTSARAVRTFRARDLSARIRSDVPFEVPEEEGMRDHSAIVRRAFARSDSDDLLTLVEESWSKVTQPYFPPSTTRYTRAFLRLFSQARGTWMPAVAVGAAPGAGGFLGAQFVYLQVGQSASDPSSLHRFDLSR